ncbi:hypothetical protein BaRGS_00040239 [Batillaria attramentaria]|uniref:AB hydrolase-1 domain-containing protein n=1 Tax=Batillaria attramentaria TaxID=370345 RepID=A0ABD0J0W2_9CAEN
MSARKRGLGKTPAKPPKVDSPSESDSVNEVTEEVSTKTPVGVMGRACSCFKYLLLLVIMPPILNYAALQREATELKPSDGELYDVGWGRKMFLMCQGKGPPTVILDAPTGMTSDVWSLVWQKISPHAKVCAYDRAGLGFSDRPSDPKSSPSHTEMDSQGDSRWQPFTAESMVDDLHRLVTISSQQPRPLILVGAELGALVAQFYTTLYDSDVLGLVLVNPLPENLFTQDGQIWTQYWFGQLIPTFQSLQLGAALGVTRVGLLLGLLKQPLVATDIDPMVVNRQKYLLCHPKHLSSVVDEHHFINETFSQMRTVRQMRSLPTNISVTVLTGNYYDEQLPSGLNKAWAKAEQDLISRVFPLAQQIVVNAADRRMPYTAPEGVAEQVLKLVRHWKSKQAPVRSH